MKNNLQIAFEKKIENMPKNFLEDPVELKFILENYIIDTLKVENALILSELYEPERLKKCIIENALSLNLKPDLVNAIIEERFEPILINILENKRFNSYLQNKISKQDASGNVIEKRIDETLKESSFQDIKILSKSNERIQRLKELFITALQNIKVKQSLIDNLVGKKFESILLKMIDEYENPQKEIDPDIMKKIIEIKIEELIEERVFEEKLKEPELIKKMREDLKQELIIEDKYRPNLVEITLEEKFDSLVIKVLKKMKP